MSTSLITALPLHTAILIMTSMTDGIFLDESRRCYVFFYKHEAERFVEEHKNMGAVLGQKQFFNAKDLFSLCYRQGASIVILSDGQKKEPIPLNSHRVQGAFYNSALNAAITLFKETKNVSYLDEVAYHNFIVPVRIKYSQDNRKQEILYGTVRKKEEFQFIAFSDMNEYQQWETLVNGWEPLLVELDVMCQISKEHGYLINPMGNKLFLPQNVLNKYNKKHHEEEAG